MNDREAAWNEYLKETFGALWERLDSEGIQHSTENTGGGCMVLFVRFENGSQITITPSEEPNDDPRNHWLVCFSPDDESFWSDGSTTLDRCASTDRVVQLFRDHA